MSKRKLPTSVNNCSSRPYLRLNLIEWASLLSWTSRLDSIMSGMPFCQGISGRIWRGRGVWVYQSCRRTSSWCWGVWGERCLNLSTRVWASWVEQVFGKLGRWTCVDDTWACVPEVQDHLLSSTWIGDEILHPFLPWFDKEGDHIECHPQGPYGMFVPNTTDGLGWNWASRKWREEKSWHGCWCSTGYAAEFPSVL